MMRNSLLKKIGLLALAAGWAGSLLAQPAGQTNYQWSAAGDKSTWSQPANWTQGAPPLADGTTFAIDLSVNAGGSVVPINIAASNIVNINDAIFGPLWGQTLNIYGSVSCGFGEFVWGDINGPVTTLNVQTNGSLFLKDTLALGTAWWFPGGPHVVMNVYSNAFVGVAWMQFGARLNLYGGTVSVTNGFNTGTATGPVFTGGADTDATRSINLTAGSKLILPFSYAGAVSDWISRGILLTYGAPANAEEIVVNTEDPNWPDRTVVTTTATNSNPILAIRIEVPRTNLFVGGNEQAQVFADYATTLNVNVTTLSGITILYQSMATNVVTVSAAGRVRAVGVGSAQVKAVIGNLTNSVVINVGTYTNTASLVHRYSFSETGGGTTADSVGGPSWDGTLVNAGASLSGGQLVLDGLDGYVQLPAGIVLNMNAVSIETWISFGTISNWAAIFMFGDSDGTFGHHYISAQPHTGPATSQIGIRNAATEENAFFTPVLDNRSNVHYVAVFHPEAGFASIYTNGVLAAINANIDITLADALSTGDPLNYIGHSLWSADPYLPASLSEFRIYNGPLTPARIKANGALGPDQLIGVNTSVSLTATLSGGNVVITWPANSALVNLTSTSTLGAGSSWTSVNGTLAIVGGKYQMTLPASDTARFFRLEQ